MTKNTVSANDIEQCRSELFALFLEDQRTTKTFLNDLNKIHHYYCQQFLINQSKKFNTVRDYRSLVHTLQQVKEGSISFEQGLKAVHKLSFQRKIELSVTNLLKACELAFWMMAAITSYTLCLGLAVPLIFLNPPLGVALTLGASSMMLAATLKGADCVRDFQSFNHINKQEALEHNALSFFNSSQPKPNGPTERREELEPQGYNYCY